MAKKNKKHEILQQGFEVMYAKGYAATSIQDIADATGIPKGSFYHYFKTKELFTVEAITLYTDLVYEEMEQVLTDTILPPLQRIRLLYQNRISYYQSRQFELGCFAGNLAVEVADSNEVLRLAVDEFFNRNRTLLVQCLYEAQDNGDLNSEYDINEMAEFIVSSYEGALLRMKSVHNAQPLQIFQKYLEHLLT